MSLLIVGSVAYDSVRTPFGEVDEVVGGSATYASLSASFFAPVHLVAVVGEDFRPADRDLLVSRGIDVSGLVTAPGRTFRWAGRYEYDMNQAHTLETELNVFAGFDPQIPEAFRRAPFVFLGNIHPELQGRVLDQMERPRLVALDTMNFWIEGEREKLLEVLARVDLLVINDAEARQLTGEVSIVKTAQIIRQWGPSVLVVKQGEYGALAFVGDHVLSVRAVPIEVVRDPTGAGDTFAGGLMGYLAGCDGLRPDTLGQALAVGSVMASFTVEDFSVRGLLPVHRREILRRHQQLVRMSRIVDLRPEDVRMWLQEA